MADSRKWGRRLHYLAGLEARRRRLRMEQTLSDVPGGVEMVDPEDPLGDPPTEAEWLEALQERARSRRRRRR